MSQFVSADYALVHSHLILACHKENMQIQLLYVSYFFILISRNGIDLHLDYISAFFLLLLKNSSAE